MIDTLALISYGGEVLWQHTTHESGRRAVINRLIQDVLLEDRISERAFTVEDVKLYWSLQNEAKFFAVAACPKFLVTHYVEDFLREVVQAFTKRLLHARRDGGEGPINFADECNQMMKKLEASEAEVAHGGPQLPAEPNMDDEDDESAEDGAAALEDTDDARAEEASIASPEGATPSGGGHREGGVFVTKDGRRIATRGGGRGGGAAASANSGKDAQTRKKRPAKAPTTWDDGPVNDPAVAAQASASGPSAEVLQAQTELQRATYVKRLANGAAAPVKEKEWEGQSRGRLANWLRSYVGTREVDEGDLQKVIPSLREKLIAKNVAVEVAEHVCGSVESSLAGKRLGTFDSVYTTVETAMTTALQRILQPKREVNVLRDVAAAKARMKPYSIVFCGVNGVGKSTSLAKITYWLQQNNFSVLLAAGDTFRHGAVEQLEVHGRCLGAQVFQMGYGSDPSAVASAAIAHASRQHTDVVMIDTAGRMQDHESRMRALAKLIHDNQPDLVLFVGEALVGNNGVDQLRKFNQCLIDFAPVGAAHRGIDGIVLTKFDTIDDKVGAALSMVYELGQPIVFVGVGQTYQDLKVIEPEVVVSALMQ